MATTKTTTDDDKAKDEKSVKYADNNKYNASHNVSDNE